MELELVKFCKEHDNWRELLTDSPYYLSIKEDGDYALFKYQTVPNSSDLKLKICQEARGLILNKNSLKPVCVPFFKFFNYGEENAHSIDWDGARVLEKKDGSLIKFWSDGGEIKISTNGTINAFKCEATQINGATISFGEIVKKYLKENNRLYNRIKEALKRNTNTTIMFELISEYNKIVVDYDKKDYGLFYLGSRDNISTFEYTDLELNKICGVKSYGFKNLKECLDYLGTIKDLPKVTKEGFVVVDKYFNRVKVKNPSYVLAHKVLTKTSLTKDFLDIFLNNREDDFLFNNFPKETETAYLDFKVRLLAYWYNAVAFFNLNKNLERKEYAEKVKGRYYAPLCFKLLDNNDLTYIDYFKNMPFSNIKKILSVQEGEN